MGEVAQRRPGKSLTAKRGEVTDSINGTNRTRVPYTARMVRHLAYLIAFALLGAPAADPVPCRAEEALVLSGGGARGLAHVGVILGLERRGHDPGIVVGTSMGAIIGGLYAAGYDARAIDSIVVRENWRDIFKPFPFEVGPSRVPRYPVLRLDTSGTTPFGSRAYVPDWRVNARLVELLFDASARARGDFDRLPRRFRSVTADAESGERVTLGSGDLARSIRASMAAAGFFAPIRLGGRLLTDGGLADYLPVADTRRLGGRPIIAVDVLQPLHRLQSVDAISVARRSIELMTVRARIEPVAADLLILPAVDPGVAPYVFPVDPSPVIRTGLNSTLAAVPPDSSTGRPTNRTLPSAPATLGALLIEDSGSAEGPRSDLNPFLRRAFRSAAPGPYRADRILNRVARLYATGLFDGIWPSVEDSAGLSAPVLKVRAESRGPASVSGALGYDNDRGGRAWGSLRRLDAMGAVPVEVALEAGANGVDSWGSVSARLTTLALGASAWTMGAHFGERQVRFAETIDRNDLEVQRAGTWLGFETRWLDPSIHASLAMHAENIHSDFGPDGGSYGFRLRVAGVAPLVQVVGVAPALEGEARFGDVEYRLVRAQGALPGRLGPLAMAAVASAAAVSDRTPLDEAPSMGGESGIPGLRDGERRGRAHLVGGLDIASGAAFDATLRIRARTGVIADETRSERGVLYSRESLWLGGVRVSALWWTPFGRIEVGGEGSTLGNRRFVVALGTDF